MKFLLVAINAKYIHSNPAVYSLAAFAQNTEPALAEHIGLEEYTINQSLTDILSDLYVQKPEVIGFSCYIWNIEYVYRIVRELGKVLPDTDIWLGGPEVSYDARVVLKEHPDVTGVMVGEGEETFTELLQYYIHRDDVRKSLHQITGIVFREENGQQGCDIVTTPARKLTTLSAIPFLYGDLNPFENKIIYYESSRGCPFRCSYCLSSIDKQVRFRDIEIVKKELQFFLDHKVKQVKFVDRTFNCSHSHAMAIWQYIKDHDNGLTNFHFEIAADILNEEELSLINTLRPGAVQMEIGVQSTNIKTIEEINRTMDVDKLAGIVARIHQGKNVHIHLDLIAGLPYEDYSSFQNSFNEVFAMHPEQLQLGFLKVLKGSKIYQNVEKYGIAYTDTPPYEVLFTRWIRYEEILKLKKIEEMVELYYNSNQFQMTLPFLLEEFETPFAFFEALADFYEEQGYFLQTPSRVYRYQVLIAFSEKNCNTKTELIRQMLTIDYYLRENAKARPAFACDIESEKTVIWDILQKECENHRYLDGEKYKNVSVKTLLRMVHVEPIWYDRKTGERMDKKEYLLFDYEQRSPLTHGARIYRLV